MVVGLDTPGPASANGVISSKGGTNFSGKEWWGFDIRTAVEDFFKLPVVYNNDANAAALYAHQCFFGEDSMRHSSTIKAGNHLFAAGSFHRAAWAFCRLLKRELLN
jgi:hypothetical protein